VALVVGVRARLRPAAALVCTSCYFHLTHVCTDSRRGFVSLEDTSELTTMHLRCPSFMQVSSVLLAGLGPEHTHSPTVHRTVSEACLGQQACMVPFDAPSFLQAILAECDNGCASISVQVLCNGK
jgi:hypothetical protein